MNLNQLTAMVAVIIFIVFVSVVFVIPTFLAIFGGMIFGGVPETHMCGATMPGGIYFIDGIYHADGRFQISFSNKVSSGTAIDVTGVTVNGVEKAISPAKRLAVGETADLELAGLPAGKAGDNYSITATVTYDFIGVDVKGFESEARCYGKYVK